MLRARIVLVVASLVAGSLAVAACVGDEPSATGTDGGGDRGDSGNGGSDSSALGDAGSLTDGPSGPCNLAAPFGTPVVVDGLPIMNSVVRFSHDEKTAYFALDPDSADPQLYQATRSDMASAFGKATPLDALNDVNGESSPAVSGDGLSIIFTHGFTGNGSLRDIWYATRSSVDAGFSNPMAIAGSVNLAGVQDDYPSLQTKNDDLWFVSTRDAGTFHEIFHATSAGGISYSTVQIAGGVNAGGVDQYYPVVTDDGLVIYYTRGGVTYTASRANVADDFSNPSRVAEIADIYPDARPSWISPDGCRLYFTTGSPQTAYVASHPAN